MNLLFEKYQGTGNDFILLDNRSGEWDDLAISTIQKLCDRRFGVGADGLIKINTSKRSDFEVDYYNSDGSKSFCGNGARCAVAFADSLGINESFVRFEAIDGEHVAEKKDGLVYLKMNNVQEVLAFGSDFYTHTGSPHYVHFVEDVKEFDMYSYGMSIRYSDAFKSDGVNVNAVQELTPDSFSIRTYERGVEDETLSCGTGVTAAALVLAQKNGITGVSQYRIQTQGGELAVKFNRTATGFEDVWLIGPATHVFSGETHV